MSEAHPYFVDLRAASVDATEREILADTLATFVSRNISAGLARGGIGSAVRVIALKEGNPLVAAAAAVKLKLPLAIYRGVSFPRFHGSADPADAFDGEIKAGDDVIILDDTTFRGTSIISAIAALRSMRANVRGVYLLFEPENPALRTTLATMGVPFRAQITMVPDTLLELRKVATGTTTALA